MEPLTHLAAGLLTARVLRPALARGGADTRGLAPLCAVAATMPDIDSLAGLFGPESYLLHHRGLTHSVFALPLLALLLSWCARRLGARLSPRAGLLAAALALATHLWLDVVTTFGTQLLAPFSHARVSFEGVFIVDPAFTLALFACVLAARLRPGRSRALALCGLALMLAYPLAGNALRLGLESRYAALLTARGQAFDSLHLAPDALAPLYWKAVSTSGGEMQVTTVTPLDLSRPYAVLRLRRVEREELLRLGRQESFFATYAWFAEFPAEYPEPAPASAQEPAPGLTARRYLDAAYVPSGPVLLAVYGGGPGFAEITAFLDACGRLRAWRDWNGRTHPAAGAGPGSAQAATHP